MTSPHLTLSRRLERAEGHSCVRFAEARSRVFPDSQAEWIECGGAYAVFDGAESPITQTFGLGVFEPATPEILDAIERFFHSRGAAAMHEVSPMAGIATYDLLCSRGYRPTELSNVLFRSVENPSVPLPDGVRVRIAGPSESAVWADVSARAWSHEIPELKGFLDQMGAVLAAREESPCFLAEIDRIPAAAGALSLHDGVALFAGAATLPEFRRRGLQSALFAERMRYAHESGCDLAMVATAPGSDSQRNAERNGFRTAYTRTKWSLPPA